MGFFDDFNDLFREVAQPLAEAAREVNETVQQVKDEAIASFSQLSDDANSLKEQGGTAVGEIKNTISDITRQKPGE